MLYNAVNHEDAKVFLKYSIFWDGPIARFCDPFVFLFALFRVYRLEDIWLHFILFHKFFCKKKHITSKREYRSKNCKRDVDPDIVKVPSAHPKLDAL